MTAMNDVGKYLLIVLGKFYKIWLLCYCSMVFHKYDKKYETRKISLQFSYNSIKFQYPNSQIMKYLREKKD